MPIRRLFFRLALLSALLGSTQLASAHQLLNQGYTYINWGHNCTYTRATEDHTFAAAGVFSKVYLGSVMGAPPQECGDFLRRPGGWLTANYRLVLYNSIRNAWDLCRTSDWRVSTTEAASFGVSTNWTSGRPPCGSGYYGTQGAGYVWDGAAWQGAWLWSDYQWLP